MASSSMLPNLLSLIRIPLGIAFLFVSPPLRFFFTLGAAISDGLDGYLARRLNLSSKLGTFLDPLGDKCFALFAFGTLAYEGSLPSPLFFSLFSREVALLLFASLLYWQGEWRSYTIKAFFFGKVMTTCQFLLLLGLLLEIPPYEFFSYLFWGLGVCCFLELNRKPSS